MANPAASRVPIDLNPRQFRNDLQFPSLIRGPPPGRGPAFDILGAVFLTITPALAEGKGDGLIELRGQAHND